MNTFIIDQYMQPHRKYHNYNHILHMYKNLYTLEGSSVTPELIYAIQLHDLFYDGKPDDEERSAKWAYDNVPDKYKLTVSKLILATKLHVPDSDYDSCMLLDLDLAILGANEFEYEDYAKNIWKEYKFFGVSREKFIEGRSKFLDGMIDHQTLYNTNSFRSAFDKKARTNMLWELRRLSKGILD